MLTITRRRFKKDRRGISNVIVIVLSLVIILAIVSNIVLWSYEMNEHDWEKMKEDASIISVESITGSSWVGAQNEYNVNTGILVNGTYVNTQTVDGVFERFREASVLPYNPSAYSLGGSTSWISGNTSDLVTNDGAYMTFRSYSTETDTSDFVDNNTSDVDSSANKGTHSNFTAQQIGPDSVYDTLTEENSGGLGNTTLIGAESFEGTWPPAGWTETSYWNKESDQAYDGTYSADFDGGNSRSGDLTTLDIDCSDADAIYVDFWYNDGGCEPNEFVLQYYDGTSWDTIIDLGATSSHNQWLHYQEEVTDNQYFKSDFKIRWSTNTNHSSDDAYVDLVTVNKETGQTNYELDLEVQWTNADFDESNEELCIYGGTMGGENIRVDAWNGSGWENLFTDLDSGWNNASVSSYLDSSTFTIRFMGGTETGDATQDSWDIDVTLLHVWSNEHIVEVEFTGSSDTENWSQLTWITDSAWTTGSVNVTLQLYNYTLGAYPTSGDGYINYLSSATADTDETQSPTITQNPTQFRNATGHWKMKIKGVKKTDTSFDLKADLIELSPENYQLDINGAFTIDMSTYQLEDIQGVEVQLRYRADDSAENWYLKAYNWTDSTYSDNGFNSTAGHTPTTGWDYYAVNLTDAWQSYVHSNGTINVKLVDSGADSDQTSVDIDFLGVRVKMDGTQFTLKNDGALTLHLVSLWITNSTDHQRFDISVFINSADTKNYVRTDIPLPTGNYTVKVVTERGNTAVYSGS